MLPSLFPPTITPLPRWGSCHLIFISHPISIFCIPLRPLPDHTPIVWYPYIYLLSPLISHMHLSVVSCRHLYM